MANKEKTVKPENKKTPLTAGRIFFVFKKFVIYICITILAIACLVPFLLMMVNSTRDGTEIVRSFTLIPGKSLPENWHTLHTNVDLILGIINSLIVAIPSTLLSAYFSALTAYALAMYKFKGRNIIFTITVVFMMIPGQLSLLGFYDLCKALKITGTYWPLILPSIASAGTVFFLRQYILSILSNTLLEAARIDGGKEIYVFHKIVLPLIAPGIATMSIGAFIGSWNNYLMPLIILTKTETFTLPLMVKVLNSSTDITANYGARYLGVAISVMPIIIAFCFCSKYIIGSITAGGVKE